MTALMFVVVFAVIAGVAVAAGRFGADTRPGDPRTPSPSWPFVRHRS